MTTPSTASEAGPSDAERRARETPGPRERVRIMLRSKDGRATAILVSLTLGLALALALTAEAVTLRPLLIKELGPGPHGECRTLLPQLFEAAERVQWRYHCGPSPVVDHGFAHPFSPDDPCFAAIGFLPERVRNGYAVRPDTLTVECYVPGQWGSSSRVSYDGQTFSTPQQTGYGY